MTVPAGTLHDSGDTAFASGPGGHGNKVVCYLMHPVQEN